MKVIFQEAYRKKNGNLEAEKNIEKVNVKQPEKEKTPLKRLTDVASFCETKNTDPTALKDNFKELMSLYDNFKDNAVYDGVMTELTAKLASRMSDYVKEHPEHIFNISQADLKKSDQIMNKEKKAGDPGAQGRAKGNFKGNGNNQLIFPSGLSCPKY